MSILRSDFSLITDPDATFHPAWKAFIIAMEGREYGRPALNTAWLWFKDGWDAKEAA